MRRLDARLASRRATAVLAVLVSVVVGVVAVPGFVKLDEPSSDGLFYEVQKLDVAGHTEPEATRLVFDASIARQVASIEDEPDQPRVLDPAWVAYSKRFYHRRWLVPALAVAVEPIVGDAPGRGLRVASLLGYLLVGPVLFLLLRRRFSPSLSAVVAIVCTLAPPVYKWSLGMRVDSWGLQLEALGLLAAVLVKDLGRRWLALWVLALAALSLTRDAEAILIPAVLWLVWVERRDPEATRTNATLVGTGIAAALPALLLGGTPVRENLAYVISGYNIPADSSWSFVASHYLDQLWHTISTDLTYPLDFPVPVLGALRRHRARDRGDRDAGGAPVARRPLLLADEGDHPRVRAPAAAGQQPAGLPAGAGVRAGRGGRPGGVGRTRVERGTAAGDGVGATLGTGMNSERAQAYGRLMQTIRSEGDDALSANETALVREAADALLFCEDLAADEEARDGLTRVGDLAGDLVGSGRWGPDRAEQLLRDIESCGPMAPVG